MEFIYKIPEEIVDYTLLVGSTVLFVAVASFLIKKFFTKIIERHFDKIDADDTGLLFIRSSITYILGILGLFFILYNIPYFKDLGHTLFTSAGIFAAALAFASQKAFSNIVGGMFILLFKPFRVGDVVALDDGKMGTVEEISLRHTIIRDFEMRRVVIPNSVISDETIVNSNIVDRKVRKNIDFGVSYDTDLDQASDIISNILESHPLCVDTRYKKDLDEGIPKVVVRVVEWADSSIVLRAYAWAKNNSDAFVLKCDALKSVKKEFDKQGIEIPFPYRTLVFKNPLEVQDTSFEEEEKKPKAKNKTKVPRRKNATPLRDQNKISRDKSGKGASPEK
ncbi:mechanosensitive ion channel protein MscS (plasmid) [Fulvitalea axinellae]|uniref:Mechanosensitive ion channel protein MscS n=1 Tax=Fulvitalea axinellae TaxID=1182444 RepID=A0AAU9CWU5_9BACT|nr:mechanosensitive ion channel protein MscS [Fulvitalea axinellae]